MVHAAALFPEPLDDCYRAFVAAIEAEGGATREFKRTQVSYGLERKFAWLAPLTKRKCLLSLDMYNENAHPAFRAILRYRADKFTHQAEVTGPETIDQISDAGLSMRRTSWGRRAAQDRPG